jgi:VWFA-related protein
MPRISSSAACLQLGVSPDLVYSPPSESAAGEDIGSRLLCIVALYLISLFPALSQAQQSTPPQSGSGDPFTLKMNVDLVVLSATAQNRKGALVSGLGKDDFQVYEDGVLQPIKSFSHEDIPVTVGLVVDNSGSMKPRIPAVVAASLAFVRSSNPQDQVFIVNFNEHVSFGLPDSIPFTGQIVQLEAALSKVHANGETALYDAISLSLEHLKLGNRDKKVLIVVSDGGDNASRLRLDQVLAMAEQSNATIYTIGIFDEQDGDSNPRVLSRIAKETGGEAFFPDSLNDISPICERIARDIRNQYTLAYVPTNRKHDGTYRSVKVKATSASRGALVIRTRPGYLAQAEVPPSAVRRGTHETHN